MILASDSDSQHLVCLLKIDPNDRVHTLLNTISLAVSNLLRPSFDSGNLNLCSFN